MTFVTHMGWWGRATLSTMELGRRGRPVEWRVGGRRRALRLITGALGAALALVLWAGPAAATWSIVAVDEDSGEVGVALASCVPADVLGSTSGPLAPLVLVPGEAAAVTQGQLSLDAPDRIVELVGAGADPADIVDDLTSAEFDEAAAVRQHAVVDLQGRVAAFTGDETSRVALDRQGDSVSVQGNLLVDEAVVDRTLSEFEAERADGATLGVALAQGLAAGSAAGGDRRCPGTTALFAQLVVAAPDDSPESPSTLVTVTIAEGDPDNPVELLVGAVDEGRTGLIDASSDATGGGGTFRLVVLVMAAIALIGGGFVFVRGLGSVRARR
jgi:uncharacterized Ntn-hydrolase superfamily protein